MPTYNLSLTTGAYPNVGGTSSSNPALILAGSEVIINLSMANASNFPGSKGISLVNNTHAGTFSNQGTPNGTYQHTFTAPSAAYAGNNLQRMSFFCRHNGAVIGSQAEGTLESGGFHWQVYAAPGQSHPTVSSVSIADTAAPTTTATITLSGGSGTLQTAVTLSSSAPASSAFSTTTTQTVSRNETYYFWARSLEYSQSNTSYNTPLSQYVGFLPPQGITAASNTTTSDGTWTTTLSGATSNHTNYALSSSSSSSAGTMYYDDVDHPGTGLQANVTDSGVGGTSIYNSRAGNSPTTGNQKIYYVWAARTTASGGGGGSTAQGWWTYTGRSFTVTHSGTPVCSDPSGPWFDMTSTATDPDDTDGAKRTRATFHGLASSKVYTIARQAADNSWVTARSWWTGSSSSTSYTFTDALAALNTQRTYRLYSNTTNSLSGATNELQFTRTRKAATVTGPSSVNVPVGDSSYSITLTDTVAGFTYYIKDGNGSGATTGGSATATGTSTAISVNHASCLPGTTAGNSTTIYVWASNPLNWFSTTSVPTGDSFSVVRGTGGGSTTTVEIQPADYGMIVRDTSNNILVDTTSRFGRIVGSSQSSGVLTASGGGFVSTGNFSEWRQVGGITNDHSTWHIVADVITSTGAMSYSKDYYTVELSSDNGGQFRLKNTSSDVGQKYNYIVVRTR